MKSYLKPFWQVKDGWYCTFPKLCSSHCFVYHLILEMLAANPRRFPGHYLSSAVADPLVVQISILAFIWESVV